MGAAIYIVLEKEIPDIDTMIDGKMFSRAEKHFENEANRLGVRPLMEFFSVNPEDVASLLDGGGTDIEMSPESRDAKDDLLGFERVLKAAQKHGVKWHLAVDY